MLGAYEYMVIDIFRKKWWKQKFKPFLLVINFFFITKVKGENLQSHRYSNLKINDNSQRYEN